MHAHRQPSLSPQITPYHSLTSLVGARMVHIVVSLREVATPAGGREGGEGQGEAGGRTRFVSAAVHWVVVA